MNNDNLPLLEKLIADFPQRASKAPCYEEVYAILASDAPHGEKAASCAKLVHKNAVSKVRGTCVGVAVLVALGMFLPMLLGESAGAEFYMTNGIIFAFYAIFAGVAGQGPKFSAIAGFILAIVVFASNLALTGTAAGIVPVVLMFSALRSLPK